MDGLPWADHPLAVVPGVLTRIIELLGPSAKQRRKAGLVCRAWAEACRFARSRVFRTGLYAIRGASGTGISCCTPSPDGSMVALGGKDGAITLVALEDGRYIGRMIDDFRRGFVNDVQFDRDGARLLTCHGFNMFDRSKDFCCRVWCVRTGALVVTIGGFTDDVDLGVFCGHASEQLVLLGSEGQLRLFNALTGVSLQSLGPFHAFSCCIDPTGFQLAIGLDRNIVTFIFENGVMRQDKVLKGHLDVVLDVQWDGTGSRLLSCSRDGRSFVPVVRSARLTCSIRVDGSSPDPRIIVGFDHNNQRLAVLEIDAAAD